MFPAVASTASKSPVAAKREHDRRKLARQKFMHFCQYVDPKFEDAPHMRLIAEKLEQVAKFIQTQGKEGIGRLMILMPPRHGKSEQASRKFPAWILGRLPDTRIILGSYGADLASKNSRSVRDLIESKRYQALFGGLSSKNEPVELSSDSRSVSAWDLAQPHRGGVVAAGVGGGITGLGADVFIGDDLFKNREEAESEARRDLVDDWWKSSVLTRLEREYAAMILFFTHWHADDLVGRLIKRMVEDEKTDQWDILMLPAVALDEYAIDVDDQRAKMLEGVYLPLEDALGRKPGEALWPSRFGRDWLETRRSNVGVYEFEALYQQMPYARAGQRYKRAWMKVVAKIPDPAASGGAGDVKIVYLVRYWDKANSAKGDYTSGVLMAYCSDGFFYILDVVRGQWSSYERDMRMKKTAEADAEKYGKVNIRHQQDPGSAGKDSAEATNRLLMGYPVKFETVTGDKETRSEPMESAFQGGMVFLLQGGWNEAFINECVAFPRGRNDDQVDAGSSAYSELLKMLKRRQKEVKSYQG
jgi:predicted phage terminase large subunit-like protein